MLASPKKSIIFHTTVQSLVQSQQTKHARRVYVGNLTPGISEEEIRTFFTALVKERVTTSLPPGTDPVIAVYLQPERRFAFVEMCTIELANTMMSLNGLPFNGNYAKIQRPSDYNRELVPVELRDKTDPVDMSGLALVPGGGQVQGGGMGSTKLFVGNLPPQVDDSHLQQLFAVFGAVTECNVMHGPDGQSKGYGFVTYADVACVDAAVQNLNGMDIGGNKITVERSRADFVPEPVVYQDAPSPVLLLLNMVTTEDIANPSEYDSLVEDIRTECAKYGTLHSVVIPKISEPGAGKVFLQYDSIPSATTALEKLNGRLFDERIIQASYFDESKFTARNFA